MNRPLSKHEMHVMDPTGHTTVGWDPEVEAEVESARATFTRMTGRGYQAFHVSEGGGKSERMTEFDPDAEKMLLIPQLRGG